MQHPNRETPRIAEIHGLENMAELHEPIRRLIPDLALERCRRLLTQVLPLGYRMVGAFVQSQCIGLSGFWIDIKLYSGRYLGIDNLVTAEACRFYFREGHVIKGFHFIKDIRQHG